MDIDYFLSKRLEFVKFFYEHAMEPFEIIRTKIENEEEPYNPIAYSEDGEPEYLDEWLEADMGIDTVSHTCISMLSSSLHLFVKSWFERLKRDHGMKFKFKFKQGWFNGYMKVLKELDVSFDKCEADLGLIEQLTLARNRVQHPERITELMIAHSESDLKKNKSPFFISEMDQNLATEEDDGSLSFWTPAAISASREQLEESIKNIKLFSSWLESEYWEETR